MTRFFMWSHTLFLILCMCLDVSRSFYWPQQIYCSNAFPYIKILSSTFSYIKLQICFVMLWLPGGGQILGDASHMITNILCHLFMFCLLELDFTSRELVISLSGDTVMVWHLWKLKLSYLFWVLFLSYSNPAKQWQSSFFLLRVIQINIWDVNGPP